MFLKGRVERLEKQSNPEEVKITVTKGEGGCKATVNIHSQKARDTKRQFMWARLTGFVWLISAG